MDLDEAARKQLESLGTFIRDRRKAAEYSLRDLAEKANVSNPYLSQIERGLHTPSVRVLKAIATALNVSAESLLVQAGLLEGDPDKTAGPSVEDAVRADSLLTDDQKAAILAVYRSYVAQNVSLEAANAANEA
ncbi:helix-turn-helix domain-containing protein [Actinospongicola halichondriae]|uniref:helix-turn-helix domain-containing protein n=1 Tax=Actinospongicola halichondriae TaxID=3236844 RepID=UPI003D39C494